MPVSLTSCGTVTVTEQRYWFRNRLTTNEITMHNTPLILNNRFISFLILALFFTLPFERIPTFEFAGFTVKLSYIIATVLLFVFIFSHPLELFKKFQLSLSDKLLGAFWFFSLVSSLIVSPNIKRSLVILALWVFVFLAYIILSRLLAKSVTREKIFNIILTSSVLVCLFGIFQFIGDSFGLCTSVTGLRFEYTKVILGFPRIQSVALEPLYFANFLLVPFFISIVKYVQNKEILKGYFWISILILVNIILTISRGAFIALGASLFVFMIYLLINRYKDNYMNKFIGLIIIIFISATFSFGLINKLNGKQATSNFAEHSVVENVQEDGSALDRVGTYKLALSYFKSDPVLGIGTGGFGVLTKNPNGKNGYGTVNNEYIEILSENGLVGLLLFLALLIVLAIECKNQYKNINPVDKLMFLGLFLGVLAILIQYNFFSTLYIIYIWAFMALLKSYTLQKPE